MRKMFTRTLTHATSCTLPSSPARLPHTPQSATTVATISTTSATLSHSESLPKVRHLLNALLDLEIKATNLQVMLPLALVRRFTTKTYLLVALFNLEVQSTNLQAILPLACVRCFLKPLQPPQPTRCKHGAFAAFALARLEVQMGANSTTRQRTFCSKRRSTMLWLS